MEGSVANCMTEQSAIVTTQATPELCAGHQDIGDHALSGQLQGELSYKWLFLYGKHS